MNRELFKCSGHIPFPIKCSVALSSKNLGMFLEGQGHSLPHHCTTKSETAISRFLNHYQWQERITYRSNVLGY